MVVVGRRVGLLVDGADLELSGIYFSPNGVGLAHCLGGLDGLRLLVFHVFGGGVIVGRVRGSELHEVGFDEGVDVAVHDGLDVGGLVSCAVVFGASVVEDVASDL